MPRDHLNDTIDEGDEIQLRGRVPLVELGPVGVATTRRGGCGGHCDCRRRKKGGKSSRTSTAVWAAIAGLLGLILIGWGVGALLSARDKENLAKDFVIAGLQTEAKLGATRAAIEAKVGEDIAKVKTELVAYADKGDMATLAAAKDALADEAHLIRGEIDEIDEKVTQTQASLGILRGAHAALASKSAEEQAKLLAEINELRSEVSVSGRRTDARLDGVDEKLRKRNFKITLDR